MISISQFIKKNKQFCFSILLVFLIICIAIFAKQIAPFDPLEAVMSKSLYAPDNVNRLGTDKLGRDILSRVIFGTRTSLGATLIMVGTIFFMGTLIGMISGYFGGWLDSLIMRIADMMISFPGLVLAIAIAGVLGPNLMNAVIAITAVSWTKYARLSRSLVLKMKTSLFIEAAIVTGVRDAKMIFRYLLPNILPVMVVTAVTDIGTLMLEIAALSFLGFGAQAPTPEWSLMLNEGRTYLQTAPWLMIYPGLAIVFVVVAFNLLGDSVGDLLNPKREQ
ncbi:peptide/nickel transport system permease protein [Enterococcus sp. PF1-24]|uniref:nickel transporter permease n=1 Tax=unclassified Enterococcus TaxID=2608891 RepID=UPI0024763FCC|nr:MULTISPECIES: nickel transporter permease [unclassified Enterococcus]MDH6363249.1 peptide/nickel transport system permease protein [Enterococcus sp. PFB1-1]MDH6400450.1 peptide/nickel transport system permease protein [Enterococcus sp. PF1-24]